MIMIEIAKWLVPILCRNPGFDIDHTSLVFHDKTIIQEWISLISPKRWSPPGWSWPPTTWRCSTPSSRASASSEPSSCMKSLTQEFTSSADGFKKLVRRMSKNYKVSKKQRINLIYLYVIAEFVALLDEVLNIFNILGTTSPFEQMVHKKSSYLRKSCKEMLAIRFFWINKFN